MQPLISRNPRTPRTLPPRVRALHTTLCGALFALPMLLITAAPAGAAQFSVTHLGTLGGTSSFASDINASGQVVGNSYTSGNAASHAFLWQTGRMQDLGTLGGLDSFASAINATGQVVGTAYTSGQVDDYTYISGPKRELHAFLWQSGSPMQDLGTLGGGSSSATDINDAGQVVGQANQHAFLWQSGSMQNLGTLGGTSSIATGNNAAGQVVGDAYTSGNAASHAFLWQSGGVQDLGTLGGSYSFATDINAAGQVVGDAYTSGNAASHAFLWQSGGMQDLGTLGGSYSKAFAINAAGQVVGSAATSGDTAQHAFLWESGSMQDLNSLIDPLSGWTITYAMGINDLGQIAASGCHTTIGCRAMLLTPVPEPETYLMMLVGVGLLAAKVRRHNSAE